MPLRHRILFGLLVAVTAAIGCKGSGASADGDATLKADAASSPEDEPGTYGELSPKEIFDKTELIFNGTIHELHIHMRGDTFQKTVTLVNPDGSGGYACADNAPYGHVERLVFRNKDTGEELELKDVGIKVRGNTSCANFRKQYKVKFDADASFIRNAEEKAVARIMRVFRKNGEDVVFSDADSERIEGQNFYGLKSFSLRASMNDPTLLRERLSAETFAFGEDLGRQAERPGAAARGGAVYRVGFVRLFMHLAGGTEDFGVYDLTEQVDKVMFRTRWGKSIKHAFQGNLARAPLADLPENRRELFKNYEPAVVDGQSFEDDAEYEAIKAAVTAGKLESSALEAVQKRRTQAEALIRDLAKGIAAADSADALAAIVDVDNVLSYMVAANLSGHWDSLIGNANNDWLVFNDKVNRWQIVTWDLDNSFGSAATAGSGFDSWWNARPKQFRKDDKDLLETGKRPLFAKVMRFFGNEYEARYREFLAGAFDLHAANKRIEDLRPIYKHMRGGSTEWPDNDPRWTDFMVLFNWKNHRYAHATCQLEHGGKRAVIGNDHWPVFDDYNSKNPRCQ